MSSVIRCRANSQKQTTILCRMLLDVEQTLNNRPLFLWRVLFDGRANSQLQTTILCRVLLDVEQTLNNRQLSYVECC